MSPPGPPRLNGPLLHPRICATLTVVSCLVHLGLAAEGHHGAWVAVLMIAGAAVCLPCAVHIWQQSSVSALHQVTASALAMVALHAGLLLGASGAGHAHGLATAASLRQTQGSAQLLMVIGLELTTALLTATLVARLRVTGLGLRPSEQALTS
jgi:cytochrome c biogenesis factor